MFVFPRPNLCGHYLDVFPINIARGLIVCSSTNIIIVQKPPKKGQPLNNGQNACPQCVHYSEVPLYSYVPERAHAPKSQSSDDRVSVLTVLLHGVDSEESHLRVGLGIVTEIQIHQFFLHQIRSGHRL